jgi:hypothetical protein
MFTSRSTIAFLSMNGPNFEMSFSSTVGHGAGVVHFGFDFAYLKLPSFRARCAPKEYSICVSSGSAPRPEDFMVDINFAKIPKETVRHTCGRLADLRLWSHVHTMNLLRFFGRATRE